MNRKILDIMMGFAGGVMLAASFWSLLAPAISLCEELDKVAFIEPAIGFLLGGLSIILSISLLNKKIKNDSKIKRNLLVVTAVTLHNIPEGLAIGVAFGTLCYGLEGVTLIGAVMLAVGIGIQNFPEGVCVSMPIRESGGSRLKSFIIGQASGIVEPIAGVVGVLFALAIRNVLPILLSFSAGAMIAVVCSELIPESVEKNKTLSIIGLILGFIVMMILDVALG